MQYAKFMFLALVAISLYGFGYRNGERSTELTHALDKVSAVTATLERERQRQDKLTASNRDLSADVERLNRLLKSQAVRPADFESCVRERDRLRELVKEGAELVIECRRGLNYCSGL